MKSSEFERGCCGNYVITNDKERRSHVKIGTKTATNKSIQLVFKAQVIIKGAGIESCMKEWVRINSAWIVHELYIHMPTCTATFNNVQGYVCTTYNLSHAENSQSIN